MKAPTVLVSLMALAGIAATAESADAAISDIEIPDNLREAICYQNWYEAIELSSSLITSSKIAPEHRQTLLDLRRSFYTYAKGDQAKPDEIVSCKDMQPSAANEQAQPYQGPVPAPRFSSSVSNTTGRYCYQRRTRGGFDNVDYRCSDGAASVETATAISPRRGNAPASIWTVGARVEGNSIRGTLLNNGLAAVRNITLTIRSRQDDRPEAVKTVAIDTVNAWSETEFVATFNHTPGNWLIESIEVN
jgi:hypothetical protein